jgi:phytoene dehydrogenase-like protein
MSEADRFDVIIVGGGHNGLVCAAYLAKAGRRTLVIEAADQVGGAAVTHEFAPGYRVSACAHLLNPLHPTLEKALALERHGLTYAAKNLGTAALAAEGEHLHIRGDDLTGDGLTEADRSAFRQFRLDVHTFSRLLERLALRCPPRLTAERREDKLALLRLGIDLRRLGRPQMRELLRIAASNIFDVLNERFIDERLKGALALDAIMGSNTGPRSAGTVLGFLHRQLGTAATGEGPRLPMGGMGSLTQALGRAALAAGAEIRTGTEVRRIVATAGKVAGVECGDGETIKAKAVVSNADPKTTFLQLIGAPHLETAFVRRIHNLRSKGTTAKLHLALKGKPRFTGLAEADLAERLVISPNLGHLERAFDDAKYGNYSREPVMEVLLPSALDASLAPPGCHVLSAIVHYAPYHLKGGWERARNDFRELLISRLEALAPGIRNLIHATELLTPADIESQFRIHQGHWHHGELALDQFLMLRPVPGAAHYRTPVQGLYLCGAGSHPGGGLSGAAGHNAANTIIKG